MSSAIGGSVVWELDVDNKKLTTGLDKAARDIDSAAKSGEKRLASAASTMTASFDKVARSASTTGDTLIKFGAAPAVALGIVSASAIKFEDSLTDVAKTTGITGANLDKLGKELLNVSKNTRSSADELLVIAEIGGQLGIAEKDILSFTKSVDIFNVALGKDFSGGVEEAATAIGKLTTLFKETNKLDVADAINRAGSAINYLGAVGAGTTANMAEFATRLGQLPAALRPTIQESLALGTLFEEMGISAEIASGGLTNLFLVAGKNIEGFASHMRVSTEFARDLLATDPTAFVTSFAQSLSKLDAVDLATTLDDLGVGTQETIKVVGTLGSNVDRFRFLLKGANTEFKTATSLMDEFNVKNNNTAAQFDKLKNNMNVLSVTIGGALLPSINSLLTALIPIITKFAEFAQNNPEIVTGVLAIGAAIFGLGLAFKAFSVVLSVIPLITGAVGALNTAFLFLAANPIILVILAIAAAVALLGYLIGYHWESIKKVFVGFGAFIVDFGRFLKTVWDTIVAFTGLAFEQFLLAISGPVIRAVFTVMQYVDQIKNFIRSTWDGIVNFLGSIGLKIIEAIVKPFFDAKRKIESIANAIREAAEKINPFHRESPSLVDNVRAGVAAIANEYAKLANIKLAPIAAAGFDDPLRPSSTGADSFTDTARTGNTIINNHIDTINDRADIDRFNRELAFRMNVT